MKIDESKLRKLSIRHILILNHYKHKHKDFALVGEDPESYTFYSMSKQKTVTLRR